MKDEQWFWSIIEQSRKGRGLARLLGKVSHEQQISNLTRILSDLPSADILTFDRIFHSLLNKSYTWNLWAAAYIINGGCSDDLFDYFRSWLIGRGKDAFYNALEDPESLKDVVNPAQLDELEYEGLEYCAAEAYESAARKPLEATDGEERPSEPMGKEWSEEDLPFMFPGLWKKFSERGDYSREEPADEQKTEGRVGDVLGVQFDAPEIPPPSFWINELKKKGHDVGFRLIGEMESNVQKMDQEEYSGYLLQLRGRMKVDTMGILFKNVSIEKGRVTVTIENYDEKLSAVFLDLSLLLREQASH